MYYKQEHELNPVGIQAQPLLFIKIQLITLISKQIQTLWGFICIHATSTLYITYMRETIYKPLPSC